MKVGFIGLGIMGKPMARNLLAAGYTVYAYDINSSQVSEIAKGGAIACAAVAEVAANCDTIITMLPNSPHVMDVILGDGGIQSSASGQTLVIDMSSISPDASRRMYADLKEKNIRYIDAPVSGGEPKAINGTLAIMAGGDEDDYQRARPIFDVLGASAVHVGPTGSGNICKLTNQIIVALNIAALSEGLMLAKRAGADVEMVFHAIQDGLAGSTVMNAKTPMILDGDYKPGFRVELHIKDLMNALETGAITGSPMPLSALVMQMLQTLKSDGEASSDHSAIARYYEKIAGETIGG